MNNINILIAEDNEISRELMSSILSTQGYNIIPASDGQAAINATKKHTIDLALVDLNMEPKGGFEFVKYLVTNGINLPVVIITADDSSDILIRANELGVTRVLQKPVEPDRLISVAQHVLKRYGHNINAMAVTSHELKYSHNQLMQRAIELAERNAKTKKGGPFGAVVTDAQGKILGEGTNGITSRIDPTAHAEIMAIRKAAEKLGQADLSECILYCSSEPTMMGQALIISVDIKHVYYGLSHKEINSIRSHENKVRAELGNTQRQETQYTQIGHDDAMTMFERWQAMDDKLED